MSFALPEKELKNNKEGFSKNEQGNEQESNQLDRRNRGTGI